MSNHELYLIHEDDYLSHIDDKVRLHSMLKQLTFMIGKNHDPRAVRELAGRFQKVNEEMFRAWGIPGSYLVTGDKDDLADLMDAELSEPEDAGYVLCDGDCDGCCPCDGDELCCEYAERVEKELDAGDGGDDDGDADTLLEALAAAMRSLFGETVTLRILVE